MLYIPYKGDMVLGLSLDILEYCGIKASKVMGKLKSNPANRIVDDGEREVFRLSKRLGVRKYAMPYFIS